MITYKVQKTGDSSAKYACRFAKKSPMATHEYMLYYNFENGEIDPISLEVVEYGTWTEETDKSFIKKMFSVDLFWLRHFMRTYYD